VIREVFIRKMSDGSLIHHEKLTETPEIPVSELEKSFLVAAKNLNEGEIEHTDIVRYTFSYTHTGGLYFCMLFDRVSQKPERMESMSFLVSQVLEKYETGAVSEEDLRNVVLNVVRRIPVKIGFVGFGGVGKTTMLKLIRQEEVPLDYIPTIFGDRKPLAVPIGPYRVIVFDFAGQKRFMTAWDILIRGSEVIFVVTDSSPGNVEATKKEILPLVHTKAVYSKKFAIANKQDLPGALSPAEVGRILNLKTYGMIAIDPKNREKLLKIITEAVMA